jgi:hypothetical protein
LSSADGSLILMRRRPALITALTRAAGSPRLYIYLAATVAALVLSYLLGKEMRWDTLDYHFYAGFSALHDRLDQDYFAAGPQSYFNPYVYVPFYLLATSGLSALGAASILAVLQSAIIWLTYEIAYEIAPVETPRAKVTLAACAAVLGLCNPILINQFGSSYVDVTTAEIILAGWLLLLRAVRAPASATVVWAAVLTGGAVALKATNAVHAISAVVLLLFLQTTWRERLRYAVLFGLGLAVSFVLISAPWSIRLERHFGNPLFPLLNGIFHSPQYPTARVMDYRFVPESLADAFWRPFAIATPAFTVDDEVQAPDLRYALVLVLAAATLLVWILRRFRRSRAAGGTLRRDSLSTRGMTALGCGFLVDWALWLTASGNGRYFIAAACLAGVLAIALVFHLCTAWRRARVYLLALIFGAQIFQLYAGADYRHEAPWDGGPWFSVQVPQALATKPALYLSYGIQSNSFIVPFLASRSGFVGLAGDYPFGPDGANGAHFAALTRRYGQDLELITPLSAPLTGNSSPGAVTTPDAALLAFGLRADSGHCEMIVVHNEGRKSWIVKTLDSPGTPTTQSASAAGADGARAADDLTAYLAACKVVADHSDHSALLPSKRSASRALDRLEDACPQVFQPHRPITQYYGLSHQSHIWARRYMDTNLTAWVSNGWVKFLDPLRGGTVAYIGRESAFDGSAPLRAACGRRHGSYYAKLLSPQR